MSIAARRFWTSVSVADEGSGYGIRLDGRVVKTPAKQVLVLPSRALAEAVAAEWAEQGEMIRPDQMPLTRMANTAQDQVPKKRADIIAELTRYGGNDLLCYRVAGPESWRNAQTEAWDPLLAWLHSTHGIALQVTTGVMPVDQPEAEAKFPSVLEGQSDLALVGLSEMTALSGSLVLALAAQAGWADPAEVFQCSRLDEQLQAQLWGEDAEAAALALDRKNAFISACSLVHLSAEA